MKLRNDSFHHVTKIVTPNTESICSCDKTANIQFTKHLAYATEYVMMPSNLNIAVTCCFDALHFYNNRALQIVNANDRWDIYIMESQETPSSSSLLFTGHKEEDTLFFVLGIIQYYRQSAFFKESITDWITRLGIVHIREVLFDERLRHELNENLSSDQRTHKKSSVTLMK